ncbi:MAG: peptide chain release factor N(5)-glutamine methyltransferase [Anaerolineae bacterium]|nr:peptide chain release factor N(5)-glutamine methyltransferase [Anaerolineae bacterium]
MAEITVDAALKAAIARLAGHSGAPRLDAQLILAHVLDRPREFLIAHGETPLTPVQASAFDKLIMLRARGMPTAYILGRRPFYDRQFRVTSHVLIPRPETENLVEAALEWVNERKSGQARLVDVGTGSGVIAVTLAAHLPGSLVVATDVSAQAALIAGENGADLPNLHVVQADLLAPLAGPFDLIAANMPYIASAELDILDVARFEPLVALDGGPDGLVLIRRLLEQAPAKLAAPGLLLLEIGADQGAAVRDLAAAAFPGATVDVLKDYGRLDRVVRVERV